MNIENLKKKLDKKTLNVYRTDQNSEIHKNNIMLAYIVT